MYSRIAHQRWFNKYLAPCMKFVGHALVNRFDLLHSFVVLIKELQTGFLQGLVLDFLLLRTLFLFIYHFNLTLSNDHLNFLDRLIKHSLKFIFFVVDVVLSKIFNLLNRGVEAKELGMAVCVHSIDSWNEFVFVAL